MQTNDQLIEAALADFRARLTEAVRVLGESASPSAFCEAERAVFSLTSALAADLTQRALQRMSDDPARAASALAEVRERASTRGVEMRIERVRTTELRTLSGATIRVRTPYASARPRGRGGPLRARGSPGSGVYPVLDGLGISGRSTPALRMRVAHAACEANSVSSAREILAFGGTEIDHKAALRLTYMVSECAIAVRDRAVATTPPAGGTDEFAGRRVVATVDGGRVLIRRRTAGRPRTSGRKHFVTDWREPKVICLYVLGDDGKRDRRVPSVIDATLGDADAVFALLRHHLQLRGAGQARSVTLVGDGAQWIWNRADQLRQALGTAPENWQEIVDYFHVVERITGLAATQPKWTDEAAKTWVLAQKQRLKAGDLSSVEAAVRALRYADADAKASELAYWERNRERLRYGSFRAAALPLGSGAVESAVRRVVNLRLKGPSIAWTEDHAEGMLHLRAHAKSGRWKELERAVLDNCRWQPTSRISRPVCVA